MSCTKISNFKSLVFFFLFILSASLASSRLVIDDKPLVEMHEDWMARHGRVYKDSEEKEARLKIFKENVERINAFNKEGNRGYKLGVNQFADMTNEEFRALNTFKGQLTRNVTSVSKKSTYFEHGNMTEVPESLDWRLKGAVTPVKDQGGCGSCWAFATVAAVESKYKLETGKLVSLSEQQLIDCDVNGVDEGCSGGLLDTAFDYMKKSGGVTSEKEYPYAEQDGTCKKAEIKPVAHITGYEDVQPNDENALLVAVTKQPVAAAIDGGSYGFQLYKSGVFDGECFTELNHAVLVFGYGADSDGTKYWLIKNSWGEGWGENGYMKMKRDVSAKEGMCGIASLPSFPTM